MEFRRLGKSTHPIDNSISIVNITTANSSIHIKSKPNTCSSSTMNTDHHGRDQHYGTVRDSRNGPEGRFDTCYNSKIGVINRATNIPEALSAHVPDVKTESNEHSDPRFVGVRNNAVYLAVHVRCTDGSFHCGLLVPTLKDKDEGLGWYANNAQGGWFVERCSPKKVIFNNSLILLYRVGEVLPGKATLCWQRLNEYQADGTPASRSGGGLDSNHDGAVLLATDASGSRPTASPPTDSMARVKRAMRTLQAEHLIAVSGSLQELEEKALGIATQMENAVKMGALKAVVM
jgi:hypothetical protein